MNKLKFEELEIYQLAEKLSDRIWEIVQSWSLIEQKTFGFQIIDSSSSIGSNIAEGYGRGSNADRGRFAKISRGSLFETIHWINKTHRLKILKDDEFFELSEISDRLSPKLSSYIKYLTNK
ncbi:MAG: four helix bundle protein [Ignavibacterium sp.]|nr:MAG: four helix bundle protein [Ignavibacterium sp.]